MLTSSLSDRTSFTISGSMSNFLTFSNITSPLSSCLNMFAKVSANYLSYIAVYKITLRSKLSNKTSIKILFYCINLPLFFLCESNKEISLHRNELTCELIMIQILRIYHRTENAKHTREHHYPLIQ